MPPRRPLPRLPESFVQDSAALADCLEHLATQTHIGFDTEFVGEDTYRPDLCLLQVSTAEQLFLIDPLDCGPLECFWNLLADPSRQVIVHAGREELRACLFAIGRPPAHVFDLQIAAGLVGLQYPIGYGGLVFEMLDVRANKAETLTDWRRRPLTAAQQKYAYDDVRFILPIWRKLHDRLHKLNREDWAAEEFAASVVRCTTDEPAVEKWRKLKGLGGLSRRELAVAREIYVWRDSVAHRQNRPPRTVLRDEPLVELAKRTTIREEEIASTRGLAKTLVPGLMEAIRVARGLPATEHPEPSERDNDPPHVQLLASLLNIVLAEWSARNQIAPNLVATMSDLKAVVRLRQKHGGPAEAQLFQGWRQRAVLPELDAFLDGRRTLFVHDPASAQPIRTSTMPAIS